MSISLATQISSQSPQTGQFNSYNVVRLYRIDPKNKSLNPLKRVNSILTRSLDGSEIISEKGSQSPQTGQFNSYREESEETLFSF